MVSGQGCLKMKIPLNKLVEIHLCLPNMQKYKNYTYNFTLNHCTSASNEISVFCMKKKTLILRIQKNAL